MTRDEAIRHIKALYPADSEYPETAAMGERFLKQAKAEVAGWETECDAVLIRYAELCLDKESSDCARAMREARARKY